MNDHRWTDGDDHLIAEVRHGSAIRRAGCAALKRNVAMAMGNWLAVVEEPPEDALAVLREAVGHDEPLVAEHAAWALGEAGAGLE